MKHAWLLLALTACDAVFGVEHGAPPENCDEVTTHDEDGDGVVDACDNCPTVANADQANVLDADGVGDVCDPHPIADGDAIVRFVSFAEAGENARWRTNAGNWYVAADRMTYDAIDYQDWGATVSQTPPLVPPFTIVGRARLDEIPARHSGLGLLPNADGDGGAVGCAVVRPFEEDTRPDLLELYVAAGAQPSDPIREMQDGDELELTLEYAPPTIARCAVRFDADPSGGGTVSFDDFDELADPLQPGTLGLDANQVRGGFESIVIYGPATP